MGVYFCSSVCACVCLWVGGLLAYIQQPNIMSLISAVFDDGDEKTLRRSSLCLKGARHFAESEASIVPSCSYIWALSLCFLSKAYFVQQSNISTHNAQFGTLLVSGTILVFKSSIVKYFLEM